MKNETISRSKPWTTPTLRVLDPNGEIVRAAANRDPAFGAALRHCRDEARDRVSRLV
jgi:hypothetical protein